MSVHLACNVSGNYTNLNVRTDAKAVGPQMWLKHRKKILAERDSFNACSGRCSAMHFDSHINLEMMIPLVIIKRYCWCSFWKGLVHQGLCYTVMTNLMLTGCICNTSKCWLICPFYFLFFLHTTCVLLFYFSLFGLYFVSIFHNFVHLCNFSYFALPILLSKTFFFYFVFSYLPTELN